MRTRTNPALPWLGLLCALGQWGFDWPSRSDRLLEALASSSDPVVRADSARLLAHASDPRVEQALLQLLDDPLAALRHEAVRGLARRQSEAAREGLTKALTDTDPTVRAGAADALADSGEAARSPALVRALGDAHPEVRARAARALGMLKALDATTMLAASLDDEAPEVRATAAEALAQVQRAEALPLLTGRLHDPAPEVRKVALAWVTALAPAQAAPWLREALDDPNDEVRLQALRGWMRAPHPLSTDVEASLRSLAQRGKPAEASAARRALSPVTQTAQQEWLAWLEDTDVPSPDHARLVTALELSLPVGEELAVDPLLLWMAHVPGPLRGRVAALVTRSRPRHTERLHHWVHDREAGVRRAAMLAFGNAPTPGNTELLFQGLSDPNPEVSAAAAFALSAQGCGSRTLAALSASTTWSGASRPLTISLTRALSYCLERMSNAAHDERAPGDLRERLIAQLEASVDEAALASLTARALRFFPSPAVSKALWRAYPRASDAVRIALLRASVFDTSSEAREARRVAREQTHRVELAVTALVASWLARDTMELPLEQAARGELRWPLGPVVAFLAATPVEAPARGALPPPPNAPAPERGPVHFAPLSYRALRTSEGQRVLVSVADGSGAVQWPELPEIVTENPWQLPYGPE